MIGPIELDESGSFYWTDMLTERDRQEFADKVGCTCCVNCNALVCAGSCSERGCEWDIQLEEDDDGED